MPHFAKTHEGQEILILDQLGYHLATTQQELTKAQRAFLVEGYRQSMPQQQQTSGKGRSSPERVSLKDQTLRRQRRR